MLLKFPLQRFLIYITICLIGILLLNHFSNVFIRHVPAIAPILFPTLTMFLMVFHTMIAVFMVMKYFCDRRRLYLMAIACAFASSAVLMLGTLNSYPTWFLCGSSDNINYNDALIFYFFRNIIMAVLFITSVVLYAVKSRDMHSIRNHIFILCGVFGFAIAMLVLSWFYSSHDSLLSVKLVDNNTYQYSEVWNNIVNWALVIIWLMTLMTLIFTTQLNNIFWYSGAFFCTCYIFTLLVLMSGQDTASYSWYQARLFETISTLFLIFVLFCDVFTLYRQSNTR
ncbi:MASE4 domain-containing protein [Kluyvera georgiana]|uniref:MASE4 domain-containing protein n=1 Tax=Kluyvera georgiana TaxID=73098 RepID=UPI00230227F4|nr:MASE4 domain-containing protein [Kluyvera georgiana]MDA8496238.1 MASE4 domain-containing protein [Kluyvera georgiana]